eukprot:scaffold308727_cov36-Tisochrysis_lutea.AAC.4
MHCPLPASPINELSFALSYSARLVRSQPTLPSFSISPRFRLPSTPLLTASPSPSLPLANDRRWASKACCVAASLRLEWWLSLLHPLAHDESSNPLGECLSLTSD